MNDLRSENTDYLLPVFVSHRSQTFCTEETHTGLSQYETTKTRTKRKWAKTTNKFPTRDTRALITFSKYKFSLMSKGLEEHLKFNICLSIFDHSPRGRREDRKNSIYSCCWNRVTYLHKNHEEWGIFIHSSPPKMSNYFQKPEYYLPHGAAAPRSCTTANDAAWHKQHHQGSTGSSWSSRNKADVIIASAIYYCHQTSQPQLEDFRITLWNHESYKEQEVGVNDPYGSLPTWDTVWFYQLLKKARLLFTSP